MKIKNYEKKELIIFFSLIFLIVEALFITYLFISKEYHYEKLSGIVLKDNLIIVVASDTERKNINNNTFFFIDSKKVKFKLVEDKGVVMTKEKKKYYELIINVKFDKKYKVNDLINISIKTKKIRLIEIFKIIWEGD